MGVSRYLSPDDVELMQEAQRQLEMAQGILAFLGAHFKKKYEMADFDIIRADGEIVSSIVGESTPEEFADMLKNGNPT